MPALLAAGLCPARDTVAGRGYDGQAILRLIAERGSRAHVPTQRDRRLQRSLAFALYRQRNLVDYLFDELKHFHAIATRFHKLAQNLLDAVALAANCLWLRHYEPAT